MNLDTKEPRRRLRYKNPPILEAVFAFTVAMLPESELISITNLTETMSKNGYGLIEPVWKHELEIRFALGVSSAEGQRAVQLGWKFTSDDGLYAVQFNRGGIVFSRLGHYESWEQFRDEGKRLWHLYAHATKVDQIQSVGVRYINKLLIPSNEKVEDFITVYPHLPNSVNQRIEAMHMRLVMPLLEPSGHLIHTQAILPPEKEGFAALLLDNDFQCPSAGLSIEQVWQLLELIRDIKDDYFEQFTTAKMRETFDA